MVFFMELSLDLNGRKWWGVTVAMLTCPDVVKCLQVLGLPGLSTWARRPLPLTKVFLHLSYI